MRIAIIINEDRKESPQLESALLDAAAEKHGVSYKLFITQPNDIEATVDKIIEQSFDAIIAGGGDGTVRAVTQKIIASGIPLAILPLGTFNYLAKELKHPNDIDALFKLIAGRKTRDVDVGGINQYVFINHSSIGFYSHIMKLRQKHSDTLGRNKLLKILFNAVNFFRALPIYRLTIETDKEQVCIDTCLVFIGNNYHFTDLLNFGNRPSLTSGKLAAYILKCNSRWEVLKCVFHLLFKTFDKEKYLLFYETRNLTIETKAVQINVVIDGDLFKLDTPLNYTIYNKKLTVVDADD